MRQSFGYEDNAKAASRVRVNHRFAIEIFAICGRRTMRRGDAERVTFSEPQITEFGFADAGGVLEDRIENRLQIPRRRTDDLENLGGGGKLLQCLVTLAGEPCCLCFQAGRGGTATARGLWRIAALQRHRLVASRFDWVAACSGAPPHLPPPAKTKT